MKKTLLLTLIIIVCIALVSCNNTSQDTTDTEADTTAGEVICGGLPPYVVPFETVGDIAELVLMANGTPEEYDYYATEKDYEYGLKQLISYSRAKEIAAGLESVSIPIPKDDIQNPTVSMMYYDYGRNTSKIIDIVYDIDNIMYRFSYAFGKESCSVPEGTPVLKDVTMGAVSLDIYEYKDESRTWFYGRTLAETTGFYVRVQKAEKIEQVNFEQFDYLPISEIEPKGTRHPDLQYLDVHQTYKPTYEEVISITKGMSVTEVIEKIGKPHDIEQVSDRLRWFEWTTKDEKTFKAYFCYSWIPEEAMDKPETEKLMTYGIVSSVELPKEYIQSDDPSVTTVPETTRVPPTFIPRETLSVTG